MAARIISNQAQVKFDATMNTKLKLLALLLLLPIFNSQLSTLHAQSTVFTYQGRLNGGGSPASGSYDLRFATTLLTAASWPGQSPTRPPP